MPPRIRRHPLLSAYSLSVEHSIVHRDTLAVLPLAEGVLAALASIPTPEGQRRDLELAAGHAGHSLVMRSTKVMRKPAKWSTKLHELSTSVLAVLEPHQATLLSGGAHPLYVPARDHTVGHALAPEIRDVHGAVFDTRAHGWSNDQALGLGVHFDKGEFAKAHAAVRLLLPLIPGLTAASPVLEGKVADAMDARLIGRAQAFARVPELMGGHVPEAVFDPDEHDRAILSPIAQALASHDPGNLLDPQWMDGRVATSQIDRGIISLHVIDTQECANADIAIVEFIITVLKALVQGRWVSNYLQRAWAAEDLQAILQTTITDGDRAAIGNRDYLLMFGLLQQEAMPVLKVWQHIFVELYGELGVSTRTHIAHILEHGTLASRILANIGKRGGGDKILAAYQRLALCNAANMAYL